MQALRDNSHVIDRDLHLFVVALVGLRDQLIDLAIGDLCQNPVALADGKQNRIQHGVDAAHNLRISTLELFRLAAIRKLSLTRGFDQSSELLLESLHHQRNIIDRDLHLFVVALIVLCDQLIDLATRNLGQHPIAFADGQQDGVEHLVDTLNHLALYAVKQRGLAAFRESAFLGCVHQPHDLIQNQCSVVFSRTLDARCSPPLLVTIAAIPSSVRFTLFMKHCCRHEPCPFLQLEFHSFPRLDRPAPLHAPPGAAKDEIVNSLTNGESYGLSPTPTSFLFPDLSFAVQTA